MSDETTPQDSEAMSPASAGSHDEPIGHQYVDEYGRPSGFLSWRDGETRWPQSQTVPLYLAPQPTLTDAEREAIRNVLHHIATKADYLQREDYHLRSLLERTNLDAAPTAGASDSPCAGHAGIGGTQNTEDQRRPPEDSP